MYEPSPTWQSQLAQVDDRVSYYRSLSAEPRRGKKREIIYRLDIDASMARGDLVVTFLQLIRFGIKGNRGRDRRCRRPPAQIRT